MVHVSRALGAGAPTLHFCVRTLLACLRLCRFCFFGGHVGCDDEPVAGSFDTCAQHVLGVAWCVDIIGAMLRGAHGLEYGSVDFSYSFWFVTSSLARCSVLPMRLALFPAQAVPAVLSIVVVGLCSIIVFWCIRVEVGDAFRQRWGRMGDVFAGAIVGVFDGACRYCMRPFPAGKGADVGNGWYTAIWRLAVEVPHGERAFLFSGLPFQMQCSV